MLPLRGVGFRFRDVSFRRRMRRTPEFRALSRWGQVPVLGTTAACCCGRQPPSNICRRRSAASEAAWKLAEIANECSDLPIGCTVALRLAQWRTRPARAALPLAYDDAGVGRSKVLREAALGVLDAHLADQRLLVGGSPTIDDIGTYGDIAFAKVSARNHTGWSNAVASADGEGFAASRRRPLCWRSVVRSFRPDLRRHEAGIASDELAVASSSRLS